MDERYKEIINMPHKNPSVRPRMSVADRAAQFAPFSALDGYDEAVKETARQIEEKADQSDRVSILLEGIEDENSNNLK